MSMSQEEIESLMSGLDVLEVPKKNNNTNFKEETISLKVVENVFEKTIIKKNIDIYSIFKKEIELTYKQLLSKEIKIKNILPIDNFLFNKKESYLNIKTKLNFDNNNTLINFYLPRKLSCYSEYWLLGGMGNLKFNIDDEICDANNEIISNVMGSICTNINSSNLEIKKIYSKILSLKMIEEESLILKNGIGINMLIGSEQCFMFIDFDDNFLEYLNFNLTKNKECINEERDIDKLKLRFNELLSTYQEVKSRNEAILLINSKKVVTTNEEVIKVILKEFKEELISINQQIIKSL